MAAQFRKATIEDVPLILRMITNLAEYEKMGHLVLATEEVLERNLFGEKSYAEVIFAIVDGIEAGFALYFNNFSTFLGKPGIYLEDLYVLPEFRKRGIGKEILSYLARIATDNDWGRMEWWVLNWNPARKFYENIGAVAMDEWVVYRISGKDLERLSAI